MNDVDTIVDLVFENIEFENLIDWADWLEVEHDENMWLDDMWPDYEEQLKVDVAEALRKAIDFDARPLFKSIDKALKWMIWIKKRNQCECDENVRCVHCVVSDDIKFIRDKLKGA